MLAAATAVAVLGALPASAVTIGPQVPLASFRAFTIEGDVVTAGTGMRNVGSGTITVALPPVSSILRAFLYWAIVAPEQPAATGMLNDEAIAGTLIAQAGDPCWPTFNAAAADPPTLFTWVYRADVSSLVVDGDNELAEFPSGLTGGEDALQNASAFPLLDGATLVVVYTEAGGPTRSIVLYDGGETFFDGTASVTMDLGDMPAIAPVEATTTFVVADGQSFFEGDGALLDGETVAGPGATLRPMDAFDGTDGGGPAAPHGLWDTLDVDISQIIEAGATEATASVVSNDEGDCLTWVAQVMSMVVAVPTTTTSTSTSVTTTSAPSTTSTSNPSSTSTTSTSATSTSSTSTSTSSSTSTSRPPTTSSTSSTTTSSSTSTTLTPCDGLSSLSFAGIVCRIDLLGDEVRGSEGEQGIGKRLLGLLEKSRTFTLKAEDTEKRKKILGTLRKSERKLLAFAQKVRSLSGGRQLQHPDPERLASTADAIRADVLALRGTF
jgi:hypothetical protein